MYFYNAVQQFQENLSLIGGDAAGLTEPEKYNLYAGLLNLAQGLLQLEAEVQQLQNDVRRLAGSQR